MNWDIFFVGLAEYVAKKSKDRSTKVGSVLVGDNNEVLSIGFNGFPRGIDDNNEDYHTRPTKYLITEHSERNLLYNCARNGIKTDGTTLYLMYEPIPCADCARGIIQCGIRKIIGTNVPFPGVGQQWKEHMKYSKQMLKEAGILLSYIEV